jgi:hypothetical protein
MAQNNYFTAADLAGQAWYFIGLRKQKFLLFFIISAIIYIIFVRKVESPQYGERTNGDDSIAPILYGYESGSTGSGKGYFCYGNNCKGGDCYGEECEAGWCYGTGCHGGDCYGKGCIPGRCRDTSCSNKKEDQGFCEGLCYNGKAYHNYKAIDSKIRKKFPDNSIFYKSECSNKFIVPIVKNQKKTWNFFKKSATFFKTGTKTIDEINNPPARQTGQFTTLIDERNIYKSNPQLYQNDNCEWCANIKGYEICSPYIPVDIGKGKVKWIKDNDLSCKTYDFKDGGGKECGSLSIEKKIIKYAIDEIKRINNDKKLNYVQKNFEIEKIRGDEYQTYCYDIMKKEREKGVGCSRIVYPKCLPVDYFNKMSTCKHRVYKFDKFIKDGKDKDDNPAKVEYFKPAQYIEYLPSEMESYNSQDWRAVRPNDWSHIRTDPKKASYSHGYKNIYSTFNHHLPLFVKIDGNNYIYKCYWCDKECIVKHQCLPRDKEGKLEKCNDDKDYHHIIKMQDDNGNIYSKCIKCDKFCPKIFERKKKKYSTNFLVDIFFISFLIILVILLFL